uniref:Uncharacterized protein n=1 Tax=Lepeophtheirus salmonis TaxID=72036 RepID=A0A0K2SVA2_LEPSM
MKGYRSFRRDYSTFKYLNRSSIPTIHRLALQKTWKNVHIGTQIKQELDPPSIDTEFSKRPFIPRACYCCRYITLNYINDIGFTKLSKVIHTITFCTSLRYTFGF